jgi:hypothetical protein
VSSFLLLLQHVKVFQLITGLTATVPSAKGGGVLDFNSLGYRSLLLAPTSRPMFSTQANSFFQVKPVSIKNLLIVFNCSKVLGLYAETYYLLH